MTAARLPASVGESCGSSSPAPVARSAATTAEPPPSVTIATRRPRGRLVASRSWAEVDELARRRDPEDAGRAAGGVDRDRLAHERAGVRARGPNARGARTAREQEHGLARLGGRPRERPSRPEVLDVDADHPGLVVRGERLHDLGRLEVGLVAERDEARDPEAEVGGEQRDLEGEVPALGDEPDRTGDEVARREVELGRGVVDAHAVRPEQDRSRRAHPLDDRALALGALFRGFAEACRDRDDRPRPRGERGVDGLLERGRRHGEDDELGHLGQLLERAVGGPAEHLAAGPVDEEDRAAVLPAERAPTEPLAPFRRVVGGADDGHGARFEERAQVASSPGRHHAHHPIACRIAVRQDRMGA